jgi:hypothetical protein
VQTVAATAHFLRRAAKVLTEEEQAALIEAIATDPTCGVLLQGTGGLRKLRFGSGSKGKSGGVRVVYYFFSEYAPVYLLEVFAKNEKANLSGSDRDALAKLARLISAQWRT